MKLTRYLGPVLCVSALGCGGGQTQGAPFDPRWSDDGGVAVGALQQKLMSKPVPTGANVAIGVVDKNTLVGVSLDGGSPWTFSHAMDHRPVIAGSVVVGEGSGEVFALNASNGKLLWKREAGGLLRGAGDDGKTTVVSLMSTTLKGTTVLVIARDGTVVRQIEDENEAIGVPWVIDGFVFLPWQKQYISIYDTELGTESARAIIRHQTSRVVARGGALFFGEESVTRFDGQIRMSSQDKASTMTLPKKELPGNPKWLGPGNDPQAITSGARDRIRLYARPKATGPIGVEGGTYTATYLSIAVGLDATDAHLVWAYTGKAPFIGGYAYTGGVALCDENGDVRFVDGKTGALAGQVSLGKKVQSCVVQADGITKTAPATAPLSAQLVEAVALRDSEHVTIQKLLLAELAAQPDEAVTKALLDLATDARTAPVLLEDARAAIAKRTTGIDPMLAALSKHYDYLANVLIAPPVGPIADAMAKANEKRAAPLLASHLLDPANGVSDIQHAAQALSTLATPAELPALKTFFAHYRGVAEDEALVPAVASVAQALIRLGAKDLVTAAAADPYTKDVVKAQLQALLKGPAAPKP